MNEQQRQAVERVKELSTNIGLGLSADVAIFAYFKQDGDADFNEDGIRTSFKRCSADLSTLLSLIDRPTTCFECSTELQGPFCPKCSPVVECITEFLAWEGGWNGWSKPHEDFVAERWTAWPEEDTEVGDPNSEEGSYTQPGKAFYRDRAVRLLAAIDRLSAPVRS